MLSQDVAALGGEGFLVHYERAMGRSLRPGVLARVAARLHAGSLDRELIAGADPSRSAALAARASKLTSRRTRALIADGLERSLQDAQGARRRFSAVSAKSPVLACAKEVGELAELLRGREPLYAPGIALISELLSDGSGPAYRGRPQTLARRLDEARTAMRG